MKSKTITIGKKQNVQELIDTFILGIVLGIVQLLDGVLTLVGVNTLGMEAEGNIFLRGLMKEIGCVPTLALTKGAALLIIIALCAIATRVPWARKAFQGVILLYVFFALVPWSVILILHGVL